MSDFLADALARDDAIAERVARFNSEGIDWSALLADAQRPIADVFGCADVCDCCASADVR